MSSAQTPSRSSFPAVVAVIGVFLVFYILLNVTYLDSDDASSEESATVERPSLSEHLAKEQETLSSYSVIDASNGKVRLPIERAKELVVAQHSQ